MCLYSHPVLDNMALCSTLRDTRKILGFDSASTSGPFSLVLELRHTVIAPPLQDKNHSKRHTLALVYNTTNAAYALP
jgi:hypothetical protein